MAGKYLSSSHFSVEWGGARVGCAVVTGLEIENSVIEYRDGSNKKSASLKMPGTARFNNIVLKRGIIAGDNEFYEWFKASQSDSNERRDLTISLLDEEHSPTMVWRARNAFPVKIQGPVLDASSNEVAIETLELAHEGLVIGNG